MAAVCTYQNTAEHIAVSFFGFAFADLSTFFLNLFPNSTFYNKLFEELKHFLSYDWMQQLKKNLSEYKTEADFIVNSLDSLSSSYSMFRIVQIMKKWVKDAMG